MPYHFIIDDPSGNSFVQNPHAPANDVYVSYNEYIRTDTMLEDMGYKDPDQVQEKPEDAKEETEGEEPQKDEPKMKKKKSDFTPEEAEEMITLAKKRSSEENADKEESKDEEEKKEVTEEQKKLVEDITAGNFDFTKSIEEQAKEVGNINNETLMVPMP
jgi:hypothetical protein